MANQQPPGTLGPDVAVTQILVVTDPGAVAGISGSTSWAPTVPRVWRNQRGAAIRWHWLLLVSGGGLTADKPTVVFQPPADADLVEVMR